MKLARKTLPPGTSPKDFSYKGRPAKDQDDFGPEVGIADLVCVDQFGNANKAKYYHGGVVEAGGKWFVYLEWGRISGTGASWNGSFSGGEYQFYAASSEADARSFFQKQLRSKNIKRLVSKEVGGTTLWAGKSGKDGYLVQSLATRTRGLPDAYQIRDGLPPKKAAPKASSKGPSSNFQPQVVSLAQDLLGGAVAYTRSLSAASGVVPTMDAIEQVRHSLIPSALARIQAVGSDIQDQVRDSDLQTISKMVFSMVPRNIPRRGLTPEESILSTQNILQVQQDLDAFENALQQEDGVTQAPSFDPHQALNAQLRWLDPNSELGRWVVNTYVGMDKKVHQHLRNRTFKVHNVFEVVRPDRDSLFVQKAHEIARKRKGQSLGNVDPELQPKSRPDLGDVASVARDANIFLGVHGTRSVNVAPILKTNFRLPKTLKGVQIAGSAFGAGTYFADSVAKSHGYVSDPSSYHSGGGGHIAGRGFFMFLCDVIGGKFYYPTSTLWGANRIPGDGDSVYAHPSRIRTLQNNEYVIFDPAGQQRIRYLVEATIV